MNALSMMASRISLTTDMVIILKPAPFIQKLKLDMSHQPKVGDKFRLLDKEWKVMQVKDDWLYAEIDHEYVGYFYWPLHEADKLDWIKPVPKCSKEFAEALKAIIYKKPFNRVQSVEEEINSWLDAHTED